MTNSTVGDSSSPENFFEEDGEMEERIRNFNWSETPLGPIDTWPQSLKTCTRIMLSSGQPAWIGWGKELIKLYNDPYKTLLGEKHPQALGRPASIVCKDFWKDIEPMLSQVMNSNRGTYAEEQLLIMERYGYPEETYHTFSYTPVPGDDGKTAGIICFDTDDTQRIISERKLKIFTRLEQALTGTQTEEEIFERSIATFSENPKDFPFAIFYRAEGKDFTRVAHTELYNTALSDVAASDEALHIYLKKTVQAREPLVIDAITEKTGTVPTGAWPVQPSRALLLPIIENEQKEPYGLLLIGLNPFLLLSDNYLRFFVLLARQVAQSIANVTARRVTEKSEGYYRHLADSVPATLWRTNTDNSCVYLNKRWYEYTGQKEEDALGLGWLDTIHPDDRESSASIFLKAAKERKPFALLYRLWHISGTYRWCMDCGAPTFNTAGNFDGYIGSVIDVHEEKAAKDALHESLQELQFSEERFRLLATTIPQIVWTTDAQGNIEYLSEQWKKYTGSATADDWVSFLHPDHADNIIRSWQESYATGNPWHMEYLLKGKNGTYKWFLGYAQALKDENGNVLKWIGAATDIQDLKEQAAVLEQKVFDRTLELKASAEALKQSNEDLQQFAHVASHDLREPVRKIKTFAARLQDDEKTVLSDKAKTYLEKIRHAGSRMSAMIEGVLHYSTISSLGNEIEPVDLNMVINEVCSDLELIISQKNAVITTEELPEVEGAKVLIYQLFYNLINNSLKFSKPGIAPEINFTSSIKTENRRDYVVIKMRDNGIGFNPASAERIFYTFERLHSKDKYEGTGLGLALCKKITQRHQGKIYAEGEPDKGSVFTIELPLTQV